MAECVNFFNVTKYKETDQRLCWPSDFFNCLEILTKHKTQVFEMASALH